MMLMRIARKSVVVSLVFLITLLFNNAIINAENSEDNNGAKTIEATEPSCC
jgi:hypothetical protein